MSKKKQNSFAKTFDKRVDIITDDSDFHITKSRVYICRNDKNKEAQDYYGKVYTLTSPKYNKDNVHIITEFYDAASDNDRIRFRLLNLHNAKKFKTIEKLPDGTERKIAVISSYTDSSEYVCSIGGIKSIKSDIKPNSNKIDLSKIKILELVLPKDYFNREEDTKKAA